MGAYVNDSFSPPRGICRLPPHLLQLTLARSGIALLTPQWPFGDPPHEDFDLCAMGVVLSLHWPQGDPAPMGSPEDPGRVLGLLESSIY